MLLKELFNKIYDIKQHGYYYISDHAQGIRYSFDTNIRTYQVNFHLKIGSKDEYEVTFGDKYKPKYKDKVNEYDIKTVSTIIRIMKMFVEEYDPSILYANATSRDRKMLYVNIFKHLKINSYVMKTNKTNSIEFIKKNL